MLSIILSFVGNQDPVSDATQEDGSIVSLIRHLVAEQQPIKQVLLLYTKGTQDRAELTQGWLMDAPFHLSKEAIALLPAGDVLSQDPVDLWAAVQAARRGLEWAGAHCTSRDWLELNASSGTPVMKSAWSILQAAGYAPRSRVWQVRNPKEQQRHQARVFQTNVQVLRQEFEVKVIKQQLQDYNYAGALTTLKASGLDTPVLEALLTYGHCRLSLDFKRAREAIAPVKGAIDGRWYTENAALEQRDDQALLREAYFNAILELKNQKFSDFLVRVSQFQEQALQYLVGQQLAGKPKLPESFDETKSFWGAIAHHYQTLHQFLINYRCRKNPLRLDGFPSRLTLLAILEHYQHPALAALQALNTECEKRNRYIHKFAGISELEEADDILRTMRQVLQHLGQQEFANPFNDLNQAVLRSLEASL